MQKNTTKKQKNGYNTTKQAGATTTHSSCKPNTFSNNQTTTMTKKNNSPLELVESTPTQAVIKVNCDTPLEVARNPHFGQYAYITLTAQKRSYSYKRVMTMTRKDSTTRSFHRGEGGYTLVADSVDMMKDQVLEFLRNEPKNQTPTR